MWMNSLTGKNCQRYQMWAGRTASTQACLCSDPLKIHTIAFCSVLSHRAVLMVGGELCEGRDE